jgi:guanine deaminase
MASDQFGILLAKNPPVIYVFSGRFPRLSTAGITTAESVDITMYEPAYFMKRAIALARQGMLHGAGGPFGAVVVRDGTIVGEGWNRVLATNDPTAHGEVTAIRDACSKLGTFSLDGCEIHTTGQPCPMCLGAIHWARIGKIYYGFRIEDAAAIGFDDTEFFRQMGLPTEERLIPSEELCREEALMLASDYTQLPGRRHY